MSNRDPAVFGIIGQRGIARTNDSLTRIGWWDRKPGGGGGGGGTLGGSILSGPVTAATTVTTGTPQWAGLGLGAAATSGVSLTISQPTHTDSILLDTAGGGDWTSTPDGARYEMRHGAVGSRWTVSAPTMRIISYREQAMDISDHQDPNTYSTFLVMARGSPSHSVALQAGAFYTQNLSTVTPDYVTTNTDSQAVSGIGEVATGGKGRAIGGFFYSWINADADTSAKGSGVEAVVENRIVANDHSVEFSGTGAGSKSMCAFIVAKGPSRVATGIQLGADTTGSFECGFYAPNRSAGTIIEEATFRDYGGAEHSLDIGGTHSKAAIGISAANSLNGIVIGRGSKTAFAALDLGWQSDGATPTTTYDGGILFGNDTQLYRSTTNSLRFDATGGASARVGFGATNVPDTTDGALTTVFIAPGRVDVARATSGQVFRAFNTVGSTSEKPFFQVAVVGGALSWGAGGTAAVDCTLERYAANVLRSSNASLAVENLTLSAPTATLPQVNRYESRVGSAAIPSTDHNMRSGRTEHYFGDMTSPNNWGDKGGWTTVWEWKNATANLGDNMLGVRSTVYYGGSLSPVLARGTSHAFSGEVIVTGADVNATNSLPGEQAAYYGIVEDRTTGTAQSGRLWGFDMKVHGSRSTSIPNYLLGGFMLLINQYHSASPPGSPSVGALISSSSSPGATNSGSGAHSGAQTYPMDYGIQIAGESGTTANYGTSSATQGFVVGLGIGDGLSVWSDYSRIGTGIRVAAYETYGIRIWKRWAGSTGPSLSVGWDASGTDSTVAADGIAFGSDVNLYRSAGNVLKTDDSFLTVGNVGVAQTTVPGTPAGTGFYLGSTGILEQMRVAQTGAFYRVYGSASDTSTAPSFRMRITASNVELAWSAVGGASLDTTMARAATNRLHIGSLLSVTTGILGGVDGTPSTGLDTSTGLATRRADKTLSNGANADISTSSRSYCRLTGGDATSTINSIAAPTDGLHMYLQNDSGHIVVIKDDAAGLGTAANRIMTLLGGDRTIADQGAMILLYDTNASRWREIGGVGVT